MSGEDSVPSLSSGNVGSRFVTEKEVTSAREKRDEEWKAAYKRLGQEPPPKPVEEVFDGRSLAEKLAANKIAKQEEWEERNKLSNQFRALEEDEVNFLDSMVTRMREEERQKKLEEGESVDEYRREVARRQKAELVAGAPLKAEPAAEPAKRRTNAKKRPALKGVQIKGVQVKRKQPKSNESDLSETPAKKTRLEAET